MQVRVLFFGVLRELAGRSSDSLQLADGGSVRDVIARYESEIPELKKHLSSIALAVNEQYASPETRLKANDEVAFLPPVSGGVDSGAIPRHHASITCATINTQQVVDSLKLGQDGAALAFEGIVRNQTR